MQYYGKNYSPVEQKVMKQLRIWVKDVFAEQ
jgi:hypothetical protein